MDIERRTDKSRIRFEPNLKLNIMAIDGTWCRECFLIEASDTGAQLAITGAAVLNNEFFLMLSSVGHPAFRRCKRVWVNGDLTGVQFVKTQIPRKLLERSPRNWGLTSA